MKSMHFSRHFFFSIIFHLLILSVLIFSFTFKAKTPVVANSNSNIINAVVMNDLPNPKPQPVPPKMEKIIPAQPIAKPKLATKVEPKPVPPVIKKPDVIALPDPKKKKIEEDKLEKQLLADIKKENFQQKKLKQKKIEDAFAKEMKELTSKSLQQQMLQEQKRIATEAAARSQGEIDKYKALILQAISQHWVVPGGADKTLYSELLIRLAPGGLVLDVEIVKGSGNESLDRSARAAVFKASPLPVPKNSDDFDSFRQFILKVKPENILSTDNWMS